MKAPALVKSRKPRLSQADRRIIVQTPDGDFTISLFRRNPAKPNWSCRFRFNGKVVRRSTFTITLSGAKEGARAWLTHYRRPRVSQQPTTINEQLLLNTPPPRDPGAVSFPASSNP